MKKLIYLIVLAFTIVSFKKEVRYNNEGLIINRSEKKLSSSTKNIPSKYKTEIIDYSKIEAKIEPATKGLFSQNAFYYLVLFGENAKTPMWIVLDKSSDDIIKYDLAYIDRDFDGIVGEKDEKMQAIYKDFYYEFEMENWINPTDNKEYKVTAYETKTWDDEELPALRIHIPVMGKKTYSTMVSKHNPKEASKIWIGYEKALYSMEDNEKEYRFFRGDGNVTSYPYPTFFHKIANTFGYPGTNNSTWYVGLSCLPENKYLKATLVYKNEDGIDKEYVDKLEHRCCGYSYYGNIIVPEDAAAGSAKLIINLQDNTNSPFMIEPRVIDVTIHDGKAYPDPNQEKEWRKMGWDPNVGKEENEKRFNEYYGRIFDRFKSGVEEVTYEITPSIGLNTNLTTTEAYAGFKPGSEILLSIRVRPKKGYYTYGIDEGVGYLNTEMKWSLPKGFEIISLKWPKPTMKKEGDYILPVYEEEISFNAIIQTPKNTVTGEKYKLLARTTFQYCNGEVCLPGEANNVIELTAE